MPIADPAKVPSLWDGDADCVTTARTGGRPAGGPDARVWVQPDAPWGEDFAREVTTGSRAARAFLASRGVDADAGIEIYVCDRQTIGHAPGGPFVFLSRTMVAEHRAPWLHESLHVLLRADRDWLVDFDEATADRDMPLWLVEGLTDYTAESIAESAHVDNPGPFVERLDNLDSGCSRARAAGPPAIFEKVGRPGRADELFGQQRFENAQVFYPCSDAFVGWLVRGHGLDALLRASLATPDEQATWEQLTGAKLEDERASWVRQLP
ncbi:MAG: hypothetical protein ABMB14_02040 [Myxococcota bacterium]